MPYAHTIRVFHVFRDDRACLHGIAPDSKSQDASLEQQFLRAGPSLVVHDIQVTVRPERNAHGMSMSCFRMKRNIDPFRDISISVYFQDAARDGWIRIIGS